jgi:kynureninase
MERLRTKSEALTAYLEYVIQCVSNMGHATRFEVITPSDPAARGCQLSILAHGAGRKLCDALTERGVVVDWREPNVIRMAPVPLYNSFEDIYRFGQALNESLLTL